MSKKKLDPMSLYSDSFLVRHWHRTAEALGISTMWITMAVPLAVGVIFVHLVARVMRAEDQNDIRPNDDGA